MGELNPGEQRNQDIKSKKDQKLAAFRRADGSPAKMSKAEREKRIVAQFESQKPDFSWENALSRDDDLFVRIMRDIIKLDQRQPGRAGPRPNTVDYDKGLATFRQLMGQDFTTLPFIEAFKLLTEGLSRTQVARKVHLSRTKISRILAEEYIPDEYDLRAIADGFNKHPSYFVEYRKSYIIDVLTQKLLAEPEQTIAYYQKILKVN